MRRKTKTAKGLYASLHYIDGVRSKMKALWGKSYSKTDLFKQKWSGLVPCSQHSCFVLAQSRGGWGGGLLAVKICICMFVFSM